MKSVTIYACLALFLICAPALAEGGRSTERESSAKAGPLTACAVEDRAEMMARLGPEVATQTSDHFTLVYAAGPKASNEVEVRAIALLERTFATFYHAMESSGFQLRARPGRLLWISFASSDQFNRYAREADRMNLAWLDGYYSARTNRVATVLLTTERTTHEAAHQLAFNSGLQTRGVMYPVWVSEGLATSFESDGARPAGPGLDNAGRRTRLIEAQAAKRLRPLAEFLTLTRVPADNPAAANDLYAQSWGVFRFLFEHRRSELRQYLGALSRAAKGRRDAETLRAEIEEAFGPLPPLSEAWAAFLLDLASPSRPAPQMAALSNGR